MKPARFLAAAFCAFSLLASPASAGRLLVVISDVHFNPLANPALAPKLLAAEPGQWESILSSDPQSAPQRYNDDSTWALFASLADGIRKTQQKPGLMIVTGDILAHKLHEKFAAATGTSDPTAFQVFVKKTAAFVALQLKKAAHDGPVVYAIGNNDDECGDYALEPDGPFLRDTSETVQSLAGGGVEGANAWSSLASYVVVNPLARHHRIISLNTTFWSRRYENSCGAKSPNADPGALVLTWLSKQLAEARRHGDKVWMIYHIPPGIDGHSSARTGQAVPMWKPNYAEGFNRLLDQYRGTIDLNLAGHTHLDDFRLVKTVHATTLVLLTPGVSPNVGQNPAFRVITLTGGGHPQDVLTYYLPDLAKPQWSLEYSARKELQLKHIDASSYQAFYDSLPDSPEKTTKWGLYYSVSRPASLNSDQSYQRSLFCATGHTEPTDFETCWKAQ